METTALPRALVLLLGAASAVIVVAGLRALAWLVGPMLLALLVVITISPVRRWLRRRGLPDWTATAGLVVLVYLVLLAFALVVAASAARLGELLPGYADQGRQLLVQTAATADRALGHTGALKELADKIDPSWLVAQAGALLASIGGLATNLVFLLALLAFLSVEVAVVDARLDRFDRPELTVALREFAHRSRRYFVVTTIFGLGIAVADTIALLWLGVPLALLWGVLSFVTNYIPNIGFLLGLAPPALLALLESGPRTAIAVCVLYVVLNFLGQSVIQPKFAGGAVGLSATAAFLSLVFWGWVFGPLGMLLAVPATLLATAVLVRTDPRARWVEALLRTHPGRVKTTTVQPGNLAGGSDRKPEEAT
ncbi:AI-2E family transporter [Saccharothrix violaceirubra]|uniref:Putative PurR-regulated permease PerM n=1 Tax=Saccharothrix violaceirubra TaxID=413306 RepID=A0A7W7T774_9PSEU|nr:AI-2E family transporter [Saccharothrix violaceirubra]MBB4966510.1 putative PurR-regulated permease PerM [Saccharothrix violaceirubra]